MRLNEIYRTYKNEVEFLVIYTREAHPTDGWVSPANIDAGINYKDPVTDDERTEVAAVCQIALDLEMPMAIDTIDDDVENKYITMPMRLYLIGADGKIAHTGERGPRGFDPDTFADAIKEQLAIA